MTLCCFVFYHVIVLCEAVRGETECEEDPRSLHSPPSVPEPPLSAPSGSLPLRILVLPKPALVNFAAWVVSARCRCGYKTNKTQKLPTEIFITGSLSTQKCITCSEVFILKESVLGHICGYHIGRNCFGMTDFC